MPSQTITLTPPDPMSLDETLHIVSSYVPYEVTTFINECMVNSTLNYSVSQTDNTVTIVRNWDPSVVEAYKEVSALPIFSEELTALNWVITIDPATADL